jgi:hypothetical protein
MNIDEEEARELREEIERAEKSHHLFDDHIPADEE